MKNLSGRYNAESEFSFMTKGIFLLSKKNSLSLHFSGSFNPSFAKQ